MNEGFLPAFSRVVVGSVPPLRWGVFLHGILGSGGNWRSFARDLAARCPGWGFLLVDQRAHGQSATPPGPHTVRACADDLSRLLLSLGLKAQAVIGHSFGGKTALAFAQTPQRPELTIILDASPSARLEGARGSETGRVFEILDGLPASLATRDEFTALFLDAGLSRGIAAWLTMNVRRDPDGAYRWKLDLAVVRDLLADYFATDLWPVIEQYPGATEFVLGGRSTTVSATDRARLNALAAAGHVRIHTLAEAGHWLQVDDPAGLLEIVASALARAG